MTTDNGFGGRLAIGVPVLLGLLGLGWLLGDAIVRFKEFERVVSVKGLAEREVAADIVIWPIGFTHAENDLAALYAGLEEDAAAVTAFLAEAGFPADEVSVGVPTITDKLAQSYGGNQGLELRYSAAQVITVNSRRVDLAREAMRGLVGLGKRGVVLTGGGYGDRTEFIFTGLNDIKPAMVEEATRNAREVALKFAADSDSRLGKIRTARQGQFSIRDRDANTPHIKQVRVVSTVEYYLSD